MRIEIIGFYARIVQMMLFILISRFSKQQSTSTFEIKTEMMSQEFDDFFNESHAEIHRHHILEHHTEKDFRNFYGFDPIPSINDEGAEEN